MLKGETVNREITMGDTTRISALPLDDDHRHVWEHLKHAIAASSGFHRWQEERVEKGQDRDDLEGDVRSYLRETLETLAY
jgi:hypothetical protein